ncbi:MAG TPA: 30S ribosomal protein S8 [Cryomorphaceae bacterium]|nr:30S ribosomal protein S8 [Cryomorphaceae bacterium]HCY26042.1 30S ribosomal protein S8 [Cryomorphaceae bacterium]|tara:strand:- start:1154 stop:1552 length:399 start_codon:yes stop_codon:yes gene_type:complete
MYTDPIADFLTRIRNGQSAGLRVVKMPSSNTKVAVSQILKDQGYIHDFKVEEVAPQNVLKVALKYNKETKVPAIREIKRISKPGLRQYCSSNELPRVKNGLGIAVVSTSKGLMTEKQARKENIGGELICTVS